MRITVDEAITANSYNIWIASGGCFLDMFCEHCPFHSIVYTIVDGCLDFRLGTIRQLNITSYPYTFDAAEHYPELFIQDLLCTMFVIKYQIIGIFIVTPLPRAQVVMTLYKKR